MRLAIREVHHTYGGGAPVLNGANLAIDDSEAVAILGPSGSGKTTLLTVIGLIQRLSRGTIEIDDREVSEHGSARRRVRDSVFSWIFQSANVLGRRTVFDNVAMGPLSRGRNSRDASDDVAAALERVGLGGFEDRRVYTLSGGEVQRVAIARAFARSTPVILADEPTGQLDAATSGMVADALLTRRSRGVSILVATHDAALARRCDRAVHLLDGRLVEAHSNHESA